MPVITANSIGSGNRIQDLTSSTYIIPAGVSLISTDAAAMHLGVSYIQNSGQLVGYVVAISGDEIHLINGVGGSLQSGLDQGAALLAAKQEVINFGQISSFGQGLRGDFGTVSNYGSIGILSNVPDAAVVDYGVSGSIRNFGTLEGPIGIQLNAGIADNYVHNAGNLRGHVAFRYKQSLPANGDHADVFYNTGTIAADTAFEGQAPVSILFTNAGSITGNIFFANAPEGLASHPTTVFDSSLGEVFGTISTILNGVSAAASTIVGGTNGGTIVGGDGNDILIANQSRRAADFAVHATLSGGGGTNALYGGGAYNTFLAGDSHGGFSQIWGGASTMSGVAGYANNTLSFAPATAGVYVDLLGGHNAYVGSTAGQGWQGSGMLEDSIANVPNLVGSNFLDIIIADNGIDRITGGGGGDQLFTGNGAAHRDTFVYTQYSDSNLVSGYDTIVGFNIGIDRIDLSAFHASAANLVIDISGADNAVYLEKTPGTFNQSTDLAIHVNATSSAGLTAADFVF